jgi:hypothetical protein
VLASLTNTAGELHGIVAVLGGAALRRHQSSISDHAANP